MVIGPSKLGKTYLVRSFGKHSYFNGYFSLNDFKPESGYAVFDDLHGGWTPSLKPWFGAQPEFVATDKYCKKKRIEWGKPAVYLANSCPRDQMEENWRDENIIFVYVHEKQF